MLTIKAEIKRGEQRVDGTYNVKIRFTLGRQVKRLSTSLFAKPEDLTKSFTFKEDTELKSHVESQLLSYRKKCSEMQVEINHYSLDEILDSLRRDERVNQSIDFIEYSQQWIDHTTIQQLLQIQKQSVVNELMQHFGASSLSDLALKLSFA